MKLYFNGMVLDIIIIIYGLVEIHKYDAVREVKDTESLNLYNL